MSYNTIHITSANKQKYIDAAEKKRMDKRMRNVKLMKKQNDKEAQKSK